jgi:hypothetical protein
LVCLTGPLFLPFAGGGPCDYSDMLGVVVVQVTGGGVNEIVRVTATDDIGESRSVDIVVVDTILAWGPSGVLSTAAQHEPAFISYACPDIGRSIVDGPEGANDVIGPGPEDSTLPAYAEALGDDDGVLGLDDLWELLYHVASGLDFGPGVAGLAALNNNLTSDVDGLDLWWCGGDTASTIDDSVDFQTDLGLFSVDPAAVDIVQNIPDLIANFGILTPPSLDFDCGEGKDIDVSDADSLTVWAAAVLGISEGESCDADFARNGVVTTSILGNGEVGVATIKAQQGGGVSPPRTINLTFVGEAALSVFINAPADIGAEGGEFEVVVVDQDGRPAGDETVQCTVEPAGGALVIVPQTGTTSSIHSEDPGSLTMTLVPTGALVVAGDELTLTCVLDRDRSIAASTVIPLSTAPGVEEVELPAGCILVGSTWGDGTDISTVAGAVAPPEALDAMWAFDPVTGTWVGFSPDVPVAVNDLTSVDRLEPFFICMSEPGALGRPVL